MSIIMMMSSTFVIINIIIIMMMCISSSSSSSSRPVGAVVGAKFDTSPAEAVASSSYVVEYVLFIIHIVI